MARRTTQPHQPARALTAAVKRVDPADKNAARAAGQRRQGWATEAWTYFDDVGEAKHATRYLARSMARLRVVPGFLDDDRRPTTLDDDAVAEFGLDDAYLAACRDALDRIDTGARGGWAALLSRWGQINFVVGDAWLIGHVTDKGEEWGLWSPDEVTATEQGDGARWFILPAEGVAPDSLDPLREPILLRIWTPHPRWYNQSDSPLRGVLDVCDELLILTRAVRAAHLSRLASKVLMLPTTMTGGDGSITYDDNGDPVDNDQGGSPFVDDLHAHFIRPIADPSDPESVAPFVIEADAEDIAAVRVEDLSRDGTGAMAERVQLVERFAQGIDLPVEVVVGKSGANHWSAWQITEDEYRAYVEPPAAEFVKAIVDGYYRGALEASGVPPEVAARSTIMLDPTDLVQRPDRSTVTFEAHDRLLVSDAYAREQIGAPEDAAPDDAEVAARVARSSAVKPSLAQPPGSPPQRDAVTAAATRRRRSPLGSTLADLDASLMARVTVALDAAMRRAIERAGARIRSKAGKTPAADAVAPVGNEAVAATLGPAVVAALDVDTETLFDGAWDDVIGRIDAMVLATQTAARRAIAQHIADAEPDDPDLTARQDESRRAAMVALGAALTAFAVKAVFSPNPTVDKGEAPVALTVPPGLARDALARAGGAHRTGAGGAGIDRSGDPVGEVAAGEDVLRSLVTFGVVRTGYVWRYGDPSSRIGPFEPHEALDGVEFSSWDDDALANYEDWPPEPYYYPGDHLWCQCSFEPALDVEVDGEADGEG